MSVCPNRSRARPSDRRHVWSKHTHELPCANVCNRTKTSTSEDVFAYLNELSREASTGEPGGGDTTESVLHGMAICMMAKIVSQNWPLPRIIGHSDFFEN